MPEPGIGDSNFDHPTSDRKKPRRRPPARIKLPGEYASFRLTDGRYLGDVMGDEFFGPESGSDGGESLPASPLDRMPKGGSVFGGVFEGNPRFSRGPASAKRTLDRGDALISGASKGAPEGIGAPSGPAMPDDDNEAGFTNLPFGPEEGDKAAGTSVSGQRPGGGRIENSGRRLEEAEKPEFTSADILDPRDRQEFENLEIAMQGAERKIALHEDRLDLFERRFKNKRIDARVMGRARRYFEFRIGQQEASIERNENRLTEIRAAAMLDAAALSPGDSPRVEDAREKAEAARRRRASRSPLSPDGRDAPDGDRPSTWQHPRGRVRDQRAEAARRSKWLPVRLDGETPIDGDALAGLMENYPDLLDGGVRSGELNGWLISRGAAVSQIQRAEARLKQVEAEEAEARAAGEHVGDSQLYGSAGARRDLDNAKGVLTELDARILKRARELGLVHGNREGVAWLPGAAAQGVDSEPAGVSAIPFDADGNVDTGRLRANRYYRRTDDGSVWYWTGKEMAHTLRTRDNSDIVAENGEIARDLLVKGEVYEVEDGTRFVWDGGNFREVYEDRESGVWLPRTDPADRRPPPGMPGTRMSPREIMDAAEDIQGEAKRFRTDTDLIKGLALELMGVRERLRNRRLNGLPESSHEITALKKRLADGMPVLRRMLSDLTEVAEPEAVSIEGMAGRADDPGRLENAANNAIKGGGEVFSSAPIFAAVVNSSITRQLNEYWDEVDAGKRPDQFREENHMTEANPAFVAITNYYSSTPERRRETRQTYAYVDPRTNDLYKWGENLRETLEKEFETNPRFADEFFATKLPKALGKALTESVLVGGAQLVGIPAPISKAVFGVMTESSGLFLEALEKNKPIDVAYREFGFGALLGMTKGISIANILGRATVKEADLAIRTALKNAIISGSEEAAREAVKQARKIAEHYGVADIEEINAAFSAEAMNEFALSLVIPNL